MHRQELLPETGNLGGKLNALPENGETLKRHKTCARNINFFFFPPVLYHPTLGVKPTLADEPQLWPRSFHLSGFATRN